MSLTPELYDLIVRIVEDRVREIRVTREEFDKLVKAVEQLADAQRRAEEQLKQLAEAQRRTEERLERLAEAQRRTEERLERLARRVEQLAEAQQRTEERLERLAEAQRRTEERLERLAKRVEQLAEAQRRTEERLERLAEAQRRTEERLEKLVEAIDTLREEVGRLTSTWGFGLEDVARVVLPGWLYKHLGIEVERLRREFFRVDREEIEVNLYGEGVLKGERVVVIGEVKSRIYGSDVDRFYRRVFQPVSRLVGAKAVGLLFGFLVHPSAKRRAEELGLYVVASYER